jgi:hypothetical protein
VQNNLFIVESPFQLLSAIEANNHFKGNNLFIIKYNGEAKNKIQLNKIIKFFNIDNILYIHPKISNFDSNIQLLMLLKKNYFSKKKFKRIFIGEYRSFHMRIFFDYFKDSESFCLDDGNISIEINNYIKNKQDQYYFSGFKGILKRIIYNLQLFMLSLNKLKVKRNINMFTSFNVDLSYNNRNIKHNFDYIKSFNKTDKELDLVYFYGSNLKILGVTVEEEIIYLSKIKEFYNSQNLDIVYLPHRRESSDKINLIKNKLDFKIKNNNLPAEIQMIIDLSKPKHIASIFSSVLMTLPILNNFESVICFAFPLENLDKKYFDEMNSVKKEYKKYIEMVELNND